jgi:hypothetical protein
MCTFVAAAGCGSTPAAERKAHRHRPAVASAAPVMPLTGLPVLDPAFLTRPALSIKIDNEPPARPQSGLDSADVVYEEVVEGGITRFLAVYQSADADPVGPVRSVRQTDADLLAPIGGLFGYSGGIPAFVADADRTGIVDLSATSDGPAYYRSPLREEPDNLYTSTAALRASTPLGAGPPPQLFRYGASARLDAAGARLVAGVTVSVSPETTLRWQWDPSSGKWLRSTDGVADTDASSGAPVAFTNVVVMLVPYHDTGYVDASGAPSPDADVIGAGDAYVMSRGMVARATWHKAAPESVATYTDSRGAQVRLAPGTTWVVLAPEGSAVSAG